MTDLDARVLDETFQERAEAFPVADFAADRIIRSARRQQRRHRAYGALGGAAAAAAIVALALQSGQVVTAPPVPAATPNPLETSLTIDQVVRANASHAWARSLQAGPPEARDLGYSVVRRGDRVAVVLGRGEALLPPGVGAVSSPTSVADGWLFIGHGSESSGEGSISNLGSSVVHVGDDLTVRTVVEADVVASIFASPDGGRAGVVTGTIGGQGEVGYDTAHFVTLDTRDTVDVALPDPDATAIATWDGDRVAFVGSVDGPWSSRIHVYDLAEGRWFLEHAPRVDGSSTTVGLLAAPAAQGGRTTQSLVVLHNADTDACVHVMTGTSISAAALVCAPDGSRLRADVSPGGRYAIVGESYYGRINADRPARIIDLATRDDAGDVPARLLDVGVHNLMWESAHALVGQATRATPVHDSATLFRWDLATSSGESLGWDPAQGPHRMYAGSEEMPPIL